jgi:hypothetical protein
MTIGAFRKLMDFILRKLFGGLEPRAECRLSVDAPKNSNQIHEEDSCTRATVSKMSSMIEKRLCVIVLRHAERPNRLEEPNGLAFLQLLGQLALG